MRVGRRRRPGGSRPRLGAVWQAGRVRVLVVGGGLAGLTAAHDLAGAGHDVVVLEGAARIGGKVRRQRVAGVEVDVGAEAMINRRPEGVDLARSLGLDVVHPTSASSRIWTRGALRPLPRTLLGAPLDGDQLASSGVLSDGRGRAGVGRGGDARGRRPVGGRPGGGPLRRRGHRPAGRADARWRLRRPGPRHLRPRRSAAAGGARRARVDPGAGRPAAGRRFPGLRRTGRAG